MTPESEHAENSLAAASTGRPALLTRATLAERDFDGFVPFADLPHSTVPAGEGIYVVLRPAASRPVFSHAAPPATARATPPPRRPPP
nr:hypothetical protein OG999_01340 [Streptomyces sp. NBC_00886]